MSASPRWKQRLQHFEKSVKQLHLPLDKGIDNLNEIEQSGTIKLFEIALELAWKVMKDYMEDQSVKMDSPMPRSVIKSAFRNEIITDPDVWLEMLDKRNVLAHTYSGVVMERTIVQLNEDYIEPIDELLAWFKAR